MHAQPTTGYVETPGKPREPGEVVVRCSFCDFEAGPVSLAESVRIGRAHRLEHEGAAAPRHRTAGHDDSTRDRALAMVAAGRSAASAARELGVGASSVARWVRAAQ